MLIRYHLFRQILFNGSLLLLRFHLIKYSSPTTAIVQCLSAYYGAVYGMQVVGNWLSCPWHWAPERRKLHHTHYGANICTTGESTVKQRYLTKKILFTSWRYSPLKFRLFILKFRGAKGLEDTIFPPGEKKISSVKYGLPSLSSHSS